MKPLIFLLTVSLAGESPAAQDVVFRATAEKSNIAMGERIEVGFQLSGTQSGRNFQPPDFRDFVVLSGPNQSTNFQVINGAVSSSITYGYVLQPGREGALVIGAATVEYQGNRYSTSPVTISVSKAGAKPAQPDPRAQSDDIGAQIGDNLFMRVELDKRSAFQGEQITATYKIYTRVNVVNYNLSKVPTYTGFWSEELEVPQQIQLATETYQGKQYRVGVLKKVALFPQRNGTLDLGPMNIECVVQVQARKRSNDIFDQFFNDPFFGNARNVNYTVSTRAERITVKPLPPEGVPAGFNGAVGKFAMEAWPDREQVSENEPVTFRVKISGTGNIRLLEAPELRVSTDFERYDPKVSDQISKGRTVVSGVRTFEYLLIPRHAGGQKIPAVTFSYFDPSKREYATARSREFAISVSRESDIAGGSGSVSGLSREDVKLLGEDIRFIRSDDLSLARRGDRFAGSPLFFFMAAGPVLFLGLFLVVVSRREKVLGDVAGLRSRRARNVAKKRLARAKHLLPGSDREAFYTEVSKALWGYGADRLGMAQSGLALDAICAGLAQRGAREDSAAELSRIIGQCDFARFAPDPDHRGMEEVYARAEKLILELEGTLR
ncbi:MAG TPA: BatD family protein [Bacteroidota bacterium]|nr:BatD family protein [Bacteroidota bacterium]